MASCFTGGECLDPKWSCLPCVSSPDYYTGHRIDGPFIQRIDKSAPGWYLYLAAPNTKGPNYSWLDPSPIYTFPKAFKKCVDDLVKLFNQNVKFQYIAAVDAMGLPLGAAIATKMYKGLICLRKERYLCVETETEPYGMVESEFVVPKRSLEIRTRPFPEGTKVLCLDQWIESGAAMTAATNLIEKCGGEVVGCAALVIEDSPGSNELREKYTCLSCPVSPELQEKFNVHNEEIFQVAWDVLAPGEEGDWEGRLPEGSEVPTPSVSPSTQIPMSETASPAQSKEGSEAGDAPSKELSPTDVETSQMDNLTSQVSGVDTLKVPSKKSKSSKSTSAAPSSKSTSAAVSSKTSATTSQQSATPSPSGSTTKSAAASATSAKSPTPSATSAKSPTPSATSAKSSATSAKSPTPSATNAKSPAGSSAKSKTPSPAPTPSPRSPATSPKVSAPPSPKSPAGAVSPASAKTPTPAASPDVSKNPTPAQATTPKTPSPAASPKSAKTPSPAVTPAKSNTPSPAKTPTPSPRSPAASPKVSAPPSPKSPAEALSPASAKTPTPAVSPAQATTPKTPSPAASPKGSKTSCFSSKSKTSQ